MSHWRFGKIKKKNKIKRSWTQPNLEEWNQKCISYIML